MDGRFGLMEIAEQIRSTGEQLIAPFNDPVGYSGPSPASMALAEELGSTLFGVLSQISQDELDIFYGRCTQDHHQRPITHEATTPALVLPKEEEREEAAEKEEEEKTSGEATAVKYQDEEEDEEEEVIMYKVDQKLHEQLLRKHYYPKFSRKSCRSSRKRSSI